MLVSNDLKYLIYRR